MLKFTVIIIFALCLLSCKEGIDSKQHPILKVSLEDNNSERLIEKMFDKIKIIPLEASQESYLKAVKKIKVKGDTLFILDKHMKAILIFDVKGNFINKIHRVGRSREEYIHLSDFEINSQTGNLLLLDPMGWINEYNMSGKFLKKHKLPRPPYSYHHIGMLDSNNCVLWSTSNDDVKVLNFFDLQNQKFSNGYFKNSGVWGSFRIGDVFHEYKSELYYHEAFCGKVYKITPQGHKITYEWDLGVLPISPDRLSKPIRSREEHLKLVQDYKDGIIPFSYTNQLQSDKYYCTTIMTNKKELTTFLYNKQTNELITIVEGDGVMRIIPKYMNDDYILGVINSRDENSFRDYLRDSNFEIVGGIENEGNPLLIKLFFKN